MNPQKEVVFIQDGKRSIRSRGYVLALGEAYNHFGTPEMFREISPEEAMETFNILSSRIYDAMYDYHFDFTKWEGTKDVLYDRKTGSYYAIKISDLREDEGTLRREVKLFLQDGKSIELWLKYRRNPKIPEKKEYYVQPDDYMLFTSGFPIDYQYGNNLQNVVRVYGGDSQFNAITNANSLLSIIKEIPPLSAYDFSLYSILYSSFTDSQIVREYLGQDSIIDSEKGLVVKFLDEQKEDNDSLARDGERRVLVLNLQTQLEEAKVKLLEKAWDNMSDTIRRINKTRKSSR